MNDTLKEDVAERLLDLYSSLQETAYPVEDVIEVMDKLFTAIGYHKVTVVDIGYHDNRWPGLDAVLDALEEEYGGEHESGGMGFGIRDAQVVFEKEERVEDFIKAVEAHVNRKSPDGRDEYVGSYVDWR